MLWFAIGKNKGNQKRQRRDGRKRLAEPVEEGTLAGVGRTDDREMYTGPDDLASPTVVEVFLYTLTQGDDLFSSCLGSGTKRLSANSPTSSRERVLTLFVDTLGDPFVFAEIDQCFYQRSRFYCSSPHRVVGLSHLSLRRCRWPG